MIKNIFFNNMRGTLFTPEVKKSPYIIFFHGMTSSEKNYIPIANELLKSNIGCLTLSIRGHGKSHGEFDELTIKDGLVDAENAYNFIKNISNFNGNLGVCGASLGATLACSLIKFPELKKIVLRAPAAYNDVNKKYVDIMNDEKNCFLNLTNLGEAEIINNFYRDLLIIESEKDQIIQNYLSKMFYNKANNSKKRLITISEATHDLSNEAWVTIFRNETIDFFKEI